MVSPKADVLFEVCYEIANKVGGVYTVITTKTTQMKNYYGDNYIAIGFFNPKNAAIEFEEEKPDQEINAIFTELKKEGIMCHYGTWSIPGEPKTILLDISKYFPKLSKINKEIKSNFGITIINKFRYFDESVVWAYAVGKLLERLLSLKKFCNKKCVAHFHEWKSSLGILYLKQKKCNIGTVMTIHQTQLGRYLVYNGHDLYGEIKQNLKKKKVIDKDRAKKYKDIFGNNIEVVHCLESVLAKNSDVFTSVSEPSGKEAQYILGRKPDIITPNGLNMERFPSFEDRAIIHQNTKEKIYRFLNLYFLPYYPLDIPNSLLFFTSGRYELKTKGYDMLFEALAILNERLKKEKYENTIFLFLFIMAPVKKSSEEILHNLTIYDAIEHSIKGELPHLEKRIISSLMHGQEIKKEIIFDEHFLMESKKLMLKFKSKKFENPPISAFKGLKKDDAIMELLLKCGLDNKKNDKVKVIFYPAPVSVADGLLSMDYHEVVSGMHLGIFPSIYEPWGYTPLETAAYGVMSMTTDVAGFGKFIMKHSDQRKKPGIMILGTEDKKRKQIIENLTKMLYFVAKLPRKDRIQKKLEGRKLASLADWKNFAQYYIKAHNLAIEKCKKRIKKS